MFARALHPVQGALHFPQSMSAISSRVGFVPASRNRVAMNLAVSAVIATRSDLSDARISNSASSVSFDQMRVMPA